MILARVLSRIYKKGGIILIDAQNTKYVIGEPKSVKPTTLKLLKKNLNWKLILDPEFEFPEAYMRGEIIIENSSLHDFLMEFVQNLGRKEVTLLSKIVKNLFGLWRYMTNFNTISKSKKDISHHYDLGGKKGEKLYDIMLDKKLRQYSMAYWKEDTKTLEEAQENKLNHIIKKLDIKKGEKILDVGSGWGTAAAYVAQKTGCEGTGVTLSENQYNYSIENAKKLNLSNQINFQLQDYRELKGKFDKIYSIGMFEHVALKYYKTFFKKMNELLEEKGTFLLHTIGVVDAPSSPNKWINRRIFPGGRCPSYSQIIKPIEKTGLIVADCETLIRHYDKTLEHWLERILSKKTEIKDLYDDKFLRMWNFYLSSCAAAFRYRDLVVFQLQIVKNFQSAHPTRDYIYNS